MAIFGVFVVLSLVSLIFFLCGPPLDIDAVGEAFRLARRRWADSYREK